ncbi:MAG TPA: SGNH/GDSL hydrolase family protein [Actinomycetota bacterium]|nr:SGNH/GDSL hydrolase family protein [Actinomycetota bacterium]
MIRRALVGGAIVVLGLFVIVAVEVWLALRRDYLPTDRPLELGGSFGPASAPVLRFVVLGDSTSVGLGAGDADDAYPTLVARRLAEETRYRVELTVLGESGARVRDVASRQAPAAVALDPDVVFVGIGANDVTHLTSLEEVRGEMHETLDVLGRTHATVVVAGAPDMRVSAWHQPLRYLAYLRGRQVTGAIEDVARARGVAVVELAEETGRFFAEEPERHFSADRFHPGALGYERWADAIFPVVRDAVSSES